MEIELGMFGTEAFTAPAVSRDQQAIDALLEIYKQTPYDIFSRRVFSSFVDDMGVRKVNDNNVSIIVPDVSEYRVITAQAERSEGSMYYGLPSGVQERFNAELLIGDSAAFNLKKSGLVIWLPTINECDHYFSAVLIHVPSLTGDAARWILENRDMIEDPGITSGNQGAWDSYIYEAVKFEWNSGFFASNVRAEALLRQVFGKEAEVMIAKNVETISFSFLNSKCEDGCYSYLNDDQVEKLYDAILALIV
jgi:hypothetical protein